MRCWSMDAHRFVAGHDRIGRTARERMLARRDQGRLVLRDGTDAAGLHDLEAAGVRRRSDQRGCRRHVGTLDPSFGVAGFGATLPLADTQQVGMSMVVQPDGRPIVAGESFTISSASSDIFVARYCPSEGPAVRGGDPDTILTTVDAYLDRHSVSRAGLRPAQVGPRPVARHRSTAGVREPYWTAEHENHFHRLPT